MKRVLAVLVVTAFFMPLTAEGQMDQPGTQAPQVLKVAVSALPSLLEPGAAITVAMYRVSFNIFDTLIKNDFQGDRGLMPALAESWRYIDPTTLELSLRRGVRFHAGVPDYIGRILRKCRRFRRMGAAALGNRALQHCRMGA